MNKEQFDVAQRLHETEGKLKSLLEAFGSTLAQKEGYRDIDGMEAVHLYLIRRYGWLPRDVLAMRSADLRLALHVEMQGWTLPQELR